MTPQTEQNGTPGHTRVPGLNRETRRRLAHSGIAGSDLVMLMKLDLEAVKRARAEGHPLTIDWALPTYFDALLTFLEKWKVLDGLSQLPDPRREPKVALLPLVLVVLCRFLIGLRSFREVEGVLFRHPEILKRLGFTAALLEAGAYPSTGNVPCDAEVLSEVLRHFPWETIRALLVATIQRFREQHRKLFRGGRFLVDSNSFQAATRYKGAEQEQRIEAPEEKVCVLVLWTPNGLIPVDFRMAGAGEGGEGETTCGQALLEAAHQSYGPKFIKELIWDRGYLDGPWLAEAETRLGFRWVMGVKEGMVIYEDAIGLASGPDAVWVEGEPPRFDDPRKRPKRWLCRIEELETWDGYGKPLTGLVIRDVYPDRIHLQVIVTPDPLWNTEQIHGRYRCRWSLEELYRELTTCWQLGEKGLARREDSYRALVALMLVLYAMIELFQATGAERMSLAERQQAFKLGATHLIAQCDGFAAVVTMREANELIQREASMARSP